MNVQGLQELTLLGYPGKGACTVFLGGCNFRCPFCHNASLVTHIDAETGIPKEEVPSFLKKRSGVLDGVCVTGGEPLLASDLATFIREIKKMGYKVKLDTNGSHTEKLKHLIEAGLIDYVAMDIKNAPGKYAMAIGLSDYDPANVMESAAYLMAGDIPYEFRTTEVREFHKREDFEEIGRWLKGASRYFLQGFVNSGDLIQPGLRGYTKDIMEQALAIVKKYIPAAELRGVD